MFFRNIETWSKKLFWSVVGICYALYFGIIVLAPAITFMVKYNIFQKTENFSHLTGFGLVVFVALGIGSYIFVKKALSKIPTDTKKLQMVRFTIEMLFDLMPLGIALYSLFAVRDDLNLAFSTAKICIFLFIGGVLWNGFFIKYLDAEMDIRSGATRRNEENKRISNGVI